MNVVVPLAHSPHFDQWGIDRPEAYQLIMDSIPLGRMGSADGDIGDVVVFLCSDDATALNGATLMADGGRAYLR